MNIQLSNKLSRWIRCPKPNGSLRALTDCTAIGAQSTRVSWRRLRRRLLTTSGCAQCFRRQPPPLGLGLSSHIPVVELLVDRSSGRETA